MGVFRIKRFSFRDNINEFKLNPILTTKKGAKKVVNTIKENPKDTAAYVAGDLVLPGILAKKAMKKWPTGKGKMVAAGLGAYAASPVGLTSAAIVAKNKYKKKNLQ